MYHEDHDLGLRAGQLGHRIVAMPRALCQHGKGTPGLSARRAQGYPPRVVFMIANRWRILLTRYELRTLLLPVAGAGHVRAMSARRRGREGLDPLLGRGCGIDPQGSAADRARAPRVGGPAALRRRSHPGGRCPALPPAPAHRAAGAARRQPGLGRHRPQLAPRAPAPARCGRERSGMRRRVVGGDLALTVAAQLAYKLLGLRDHRPARAWPGPGRVRFSHVRAGRVRARGAGHGVRQQRAPDPRGRGGAAPSAAAAGRGPGRAA